MGIDEGIAVVAMSVRAPGIDDLSDLQHGLVKQSAASRTAPAGRWFNRSPRPEEFVKPARGHFVPDIYSFDERAFGLPREQATRLDPQQRLMLETGRQSLESAGLLGSHVSRDVGVFIGARMNTYGYADAASESSEDPALAASALWGRSQNFIAAWLSDRFDLTGPAMVLDTACSSSLTALWAGAAALRAGECSASLVGGVDLLIDPLTIPLLDKAEALSPDGACKTFERQANGYAPGEGAGTVVLKPLARALQDGDNVLAMLLDVRTNNDGQTMGVTTPNPRAQVELLRKAYDGIDPRRIGFIEAHGTGTLIGDPIEVQALTEAFKGHDLPAGSIALHSLKRSVGHLHSAAGIVGLIHTIVHLQSGRRPEMGALDLNPRLQLAATPFSMGQAGSAERSSETWDTAGISAFGFGGTNVHAVLSKAPHVESGELDEERTRSLVLSAPTPYQLRELAAQWTEVLEGATSRQASTMIDAQRDRIGTYQCRLGVAGAVDEIRSGLRRLVLGQDAESPRTPEPIRLGAVSTTDAAWIEQIRMLSTRVDTDLRAVEQAAGVEAAAMPRELLVPVATLALAAVLADEGIPAEAVELGEGGDALREYAWGRRAIQGALPELMQHLKASGSTVVGENDTVIGRLEAGKTAPLVVAETVVRAFVAGHEVARALSGSRGEAPILPTWQYTGAPLSLPQRTLAEGEHTNQIRGTRGAAIEQIAMRYSREFTPSDVPIMLHEVFHTPMLPGVGWLSFIAEAVGGLAAMSVGNLTFESPLRPTGTTKVIMETDNTGSFTITSESGQSFARGEIRPYSSPPEGISEALAGLAASQGRLVSGTSVYRWLRRLGYYHGRYYRNISWAVSTPTGTIARIEGQRQKDVDPDNNAMPIGLLDSVTIAAVDPESSAFGSDDADVVVPLSIRQAQCWGSLADAAYAVSFRKYVSAETQRFDQHILDKDGRVLMSMLDITSKKVPQGAFETARAPTHSFVAQAEQPAQVAGSGIEVSGAAPSSSGDSFVNRVGSALGVGPADHDSELLALGMSSADLVEASARIGEAVGVELYPTVLFEYPTVGSFAQYLIDEGVSQSSALGSAPARTEGSTPAAEQHAQAVKGAPAMSAPEANIDAEPRADHPAPSRQDPIDESTAAAVDSGGVDIIGASIRVPGSEDLESFWSLLEQGSSSIGAPTSSSVRSTESMGYGSYLEGIELFDPEPFRISPREAPMIDVQARIVYETILHAIEDAGGARTSNVGLWVGYGHDHYAEEKIRVGVDSGRGLGLPAMVANRLSHIMDWRGPSRVTSTLCSSGLVALHEACQALADNECDIAVVSGVQVGLSSSYFASMNELGALSPEGRSLPFDDRADGFVPGEGAVAVVLQRSADARDQRRRARAVVLGSAVNHNGRTSRYSAPSAKGQSDVVLKALRRADIDPRTIGMVEAHGTGTALGDPIEIDGLTRAWRSFTQDAQFCSIGSVKSNVGHLEPAAGLAGLVKVIMAMKKQRIPPTAGLRRPNERIKFADTPFFLTDRLRDWPQQGRPRRGAVSAFGLGGTNAHVIIEEPPQADAVPPTARSGSSLVRLTASCEHALRELASAVKEQATAEPTLAHAMGATLTSGRDSQRLRLVCAGTADQIGEQVEAFLAGESSAHRKPSVDAHLTLVYPGQGSQVTGMGSKLIEELPEFDEAVRRIDLEGASLGLPTLKSVWSMSREELAETQNAQIALVGFQVATTLVLRHWGIHPSAVVGHSIGELVALWASGSFDLRTLLELVRRRSLSMSQAPRGGAMAAVWADRDELQRHLVGSPEVEVAAFNSPTLFTLSGPAEALREFRERSGLRMQPLTVSHAFHSQAMTQAGSQFQAATEELLVGERISSPAVACAATSRPGWHDEETVADAGRWGDSLSGPVDFVGAVQRIGAEGGQVFIELGPRPTLLSAGRETLPYATWFSLAAGGKRDPHGATAADMHALMRALAPFTEPNWPAITPVRELVDAPMYPFQRKSFWVGKEN